MKQKQNFYYKNKNIDLFIKRDGLRCMSIYFDNEKVVPKPEEIDFSQRVLKSVIYIKGAYILKMFSDIVGLENFYLVCLNWMKLYRNKSADVNQFISVVNSSLNKDFSKFFNVWLKNVGFPFLNCMMIRILLSASDCHSCRSAVKFISSMFQSFMKLMVR